MSSDNESNDNLEGNPPTENPVGPDPARAELSLHQKTERLINLVQKYRHVYDLEDPSHKDKGKTANAWAEISPEIQEPASWCKAKWKAIKEYYYGVKSGKKGRSGQKRGKGITWPYYNMMSFLDGVKYSNENTVSNLDFEVPAKVPRAENQGQVVGEPSESTRVESYKDCTPKSSLPVKKRNLNYNDEVNIKMLEFLDKTSQSFASTPEEPQDEVKCWTRLVESRLQKLHPAVATSVMMQCDQIIVNAMQPPPPFGPIHVYNRDDEPVYHPQ